MRPFIVEFLGTPEAGKTTSIKLLRRTIMDQGYRVGTVRESAEIVPDMFETGSIKGNVWMTMKTGQRLYEEANKPNDIILVDRGVVYALFWNHLYANKGEFTEEKNKCVSDFFTAIGIKTDFAVFLTIPADESIRRRGGEGHLVNQDFIESFNSELLNFLPSVDTAMYVLNTNQKTPAEVHDCLLEEIIKAYTAFKQDQFK